MKIPVTNIYFINPDDGMDDATQFDTQDEKELAQLWWEFCKENKIIDCYMGYADYKNGVMEGEYI